MEAFEHKHDYSGSIYDGKGGDEYGEEKVQTIPTQFEFVAGSEHEMHRADSEVSFGTKHNKSSFVELAPQAASPQAVPVSQPQTPSVEWTPERWEDSDHDFDDRVKRMSVLLNDGFQLGGILGNAKEESQRYRVEERKTINVIRRAQMRFSIIGFGNYGDGDRKRRSSSLSLQSAVSAPEAGSAPLDTIIAMVAGKQTPVQRTCLETFDETAEANLSVSSVLK
eukprot:CAMPEP_0202465956 /NCGR_PEP_ID=MMETSP1360-20130828/67206_1 /ASSEMBLY_ACC=CAM_ASM_000848 /TAXON_ID=515479 /ORGANISM="Licmophora paradoxa, Strain CCMP2313" /LENGTH=222 /DNA_ID=CAMNT_0049089919 /DNA_START=315 /DNA_END=983 /DNA_ORIENTATION=-